MSAVTPTAMTIVGVIGGITALFAATIGLVQTDIKRVLAYSTVSQLGYMFLGCGIGAYTAAVFHLMTHAFFKALLFLGSGSVIHAMGGEQDIRNIRGDHRAAPPVRETGADGVIQNVGRVLVVADVRAMQGFHHFAIHAARPDVLLAPDLLSFLRRVPGRPGGGWERTSMRSVGRLPVRST